MLSKKENKVNAENFKKLSSMGMLWFGEESEHLEKIHELTDSQSLCKVIYGPILVCTM